MGITLRKTVPLADQLAVKQIELEEAAVTKEDEAHELASLAAIARQDSHTAAAHAEAVGQALGILASAGVRL